MTERSDIFDLIAGGDIAGLRELLGGKPFAARERNESGVSALMWACYNFRPEVVGMVRAAIKPDEVDIFEAAMLGETERVQKLLDAQPGSRTTFSPDGFPLLGFACFFGHMGTAKLLLERGANPNVAAKNPMKVFPINSAASRKRTDIVELLLDHGADPNAAQHLGYTSLHSAAHNGDVETIRLLMNRGADANPVNDDGKTPLQMAEEGGHEEAAALLRERN